MIREAMPADAPTLRALAAAIDAEAPYLLRSPGERPVWAASRHPADDLAAFRATGNSAVFVAEVDGAPAGYLAATGGRLACTRGVATLALAVRADARGRGLGSGLFTAVQAWAAARGLHRLELTAAAPNAGALRLYRRLGFVDEGVLRGALRIAGRPCDEVLLGMLFLPDDAPVPEVAPPAPDPVPPAPPGAVEVREARPADAAAYGACDRAVRTETRFLLRTAAEGLTDTAAAGRFLAGQAVSARAATLVAVQGSAIIGLASVWGAPHARTAHDWSLTLAVRRPWWGRGVAGRLLAAVEARARAGGCTRLSLWVLAHNTRARALYARHGFMQEAVARRFARIDGGYADHVAMAKPYAEGD
ncbi:GNAT family N-acetyltransferase [Azospirillum halopraeferens]|uniref:GNAT family N-acetyltransferase n=1 Tax=Azospirillum halopraeferens TaxID=34010 RepID=UPI0004269A6D|nr:GNAT family N-acetyltransferase [Azospirillum halopraeferens]